jgi:prefoldin subunit 5
MATTDSVIEIMKTINAYLESIERELDAMGKDIEQLNKTLDMLRENNEEKTEPISLA